MAFALLQPTRHEVYPFIDPKEGLSNAAAGKTILVTGAGTGIGKGIAEAFALAGATTLVLAARRTEPLEDTKASISTLAPHCNVVVAGGTDVASEDSVKRLFGSLSPSLPDVVISNAGVSGTTANVSESDPDTWWRDIDVNLRGAYLIARTYIQSLKIAGGREGIIINVSSNASWKNVPGRSSYSASKIALNNLTEHIDAEEIELGSGVHCVAMHPGGVDTSLAQTLPEAIRKKILVDKPDLPGGTAVYLTTERARFLMGRYVPATWDMEELERCRERVEKEDLLKSRIVGMA